MVKNPKPKQSPPAKKQAPPAKKQETPAKMSHALRQMKFMQRRDGAAKTRVVNSQPDGAESAPADTGTMLRRPPALRPASANPRFTSSLDIRWMIEGQVK